MIFRRFHHSVRCTSLHHRPHCRSPFPSLSSGSGSGVSSDAFSGKQSQLYSPVSFFVLPAHTERSPPLMQLPCSQSLSRWTKHAAVQSVQACITLANFNRRRFCSNGVRLRSRVQALRRVLLSQRRRALLVKECQEFNRVLHSLLEHN